MLVCLYSAENCQRKLLTKVKCTILLHCKSLNANEVTQVLFSFHPAVKKDLKEENDDRMQQFKKKAKELRILDSKTAQNLCK